MLVPSSLPHITGKTGRGGSRRQRAVPRQVESPFHGLFESTRQWSSPWEPPKPYCKEVFPWSPVGVSVLSCLWGDCCFSSSYYNLGRRNTSFQYSSPGAGTIYGPDLVMGSQQKGYYSKAPTYLKIMQREAVLTTYKQLQQLRWISSWTSVGSETSTGPCGSLPTQDVLWLKSLGNTGAQ